jgi:Pentatricopeptide repeat domain
MIVVRMRHLPQQQLLLLILVALVLVVPTIRSSSSSSGIAFALHANIIRPDRRRRGRRQLGLLPRTRQALSLAPPSKTTTSSLRGDRSSVLAMAAARAGGGGGGGAAPPTLQGGNWDHRAPRPHRRSLPGRRSLEALALKPMSTATPVPASAREASTDDSNDNIVRPQTSRKQQQQPQQQQQQQQSPSWPRSNAAHPSRNHRRPHHHHHRSNSNSNNALPPPQFQSRKRARLSSIVQSVEALLVRLPQQDQTGASRCEGKVDLTAAAAPEPPPPLATSLRRLLEARTQADVVEAGARIEELLFDDDEEGGTKAASPSPASRVVYSPRVLDLVLRGVALTGLMPLSARLWDHLVVQQQAKQQKHVEQDAPAAMPMMQLKTTSAAAAAGRSVKVSDMPIPSYSTQEVVCHTLRRAGRLALLRHVLDSLQDLAASAAASSRPSTTSNGAPVMSPVAFNMVLAAHCEADPQDGGGGGLDEAYRILRTGWEAPSKASSPRTATSTTRRPASLLVDVDAVAFATVLQACARTGNAPLSQKVWDDMASNAPNNVTPNVVAYNARLQLALQHPASAPQSSRDQAALTVWKELIEAVQPDQYSIDWIVTPLLRTGKEATLGIILNHFVAENAQPVASLAFTAFLTTVVQSGHVQAAHKLFDKYLLPSLSPVISGPVNSIRLVRPTTRHFNVLLSGYQNQHYQQLRVREAKHRAAATITADNSTKSPSNEDLEGASGTVPSPRDEAIKLYQLMQTTQDCQPNEITRTILLSMSASSEEIVDLVSDELECRKERTTGRPHMHGSVLRAATMAAGKVGDASLAVWLHAALEASVVAASKEDRGVRMWNVLVGALASADAVAYHEGKAECPKVDVLAPADKYGPRLAFGENEVNLPSHEVCQTFHDRTIQDGFRCYLNRIQHGGQRGAQPAQPPPNSQTYCLIASVFQRRCPGPDLALSLFRNATRNHGVPADGRFVNAALRCFGSDLDRALEAWKGEIRPATLAHDARYRSSPSVQRSATKKPQQKGGTYLSSGKSLTAAYHGLLYVCGRAAAPHMALRVVYAMRRDGLEPDETALNCYHSGKHDEAQIQQRRASDESPQQQPSVADAARERKVDNTGWALRRIKDTFLGKDRNPYESLLLVECTQFNPSDRRRIGEQRVRIIV